MWSVLFFPALYNMVVDSKELLGGIGDKIGALPVLNVVCRNPFYTAVVICMVVCIVCLFVFSDVDGVWMKSAKVGVYSLLFVTGVQFLQNKHVMAETTDAKTTAVTAEVFDPELTRREERVNVVGAYVPPSIDVSFM